MYLSVLRQCCKGLTLSSSQRYLQAPSVGSFLINGDSIDNERLLLSWKSSKHNEVFRKQHPKFCSSSFRENPANQSNYNLSQVKHKLNQYASVLNKENFMSLTILSSNLTSSSKEFINTLKNDVTDLKSCPMPPLILGFGGLVPFVAAPAHFIMSAAFAPGVAFGQLAYGAIILSFIGGIRWGVNLDDPKWENLTGSVIPSLIGWSALLVPHWLGCCLVGGGLISMASTDRNHPRYQPWFRSLRVALTTIAVLSIGSSLFLGFVLPASRK